MKAVILAAGRGTRMGPLCETVPKPLLPILGRPKLAYTLDMLPDDIDEVIFIVGYLGDKIKEFFGSFYAGRRITYREQKDLNGTGGAVMLVKDIIADQERFLVLMGDDLYQKDDLASLLRYDFALLAFETKDADQFGLVDVDDEGFLKNVVERPHKRTQGLVNTGAYVLSPAYFTMPLVPISETEYGLPQTLVAARATYPVQVVVTDRWFPIGDAVALQKAQTEIKNYL